MIPCMAFLLCMSWAGCGSKEKRVFSEAEERSADRDIENVGTLVDGYVDNGSEICKSDSFVVMKEKKYYATDVVDKDNRMVSGDGEDGFLPYNIFVRELFLKIPGKLRGMTLDRSKAIHEMLVYNGLREYKGDNAREKINSFINPTEIMNAFDRSENFKVHHIPAPAEFSIGIQTRFVYIYPSDSADDLITFCIVDGFDSGSGMGAGISASEKYVSVIRSEADWCHDGIITNSLIFKGGKPSQDILPLINNRLLKELENDESGVQGVADRVPDNVRICKGGLEFVFQKYEVACGAAGNYAQFIPWQSLRPYLKEDFYKFATSLKDWNKINIPEFEY